ncbi:MAG: hypothetical protein ACFE8O_06660 [Candidatus Hermodarchaeota archaeon]
MTKADKCQECEHTNDFKGCALQHITTARKLLAEGDIEGAEHQLSCVERHLKQI